MRKAPTGPTKDKVMVYLSPVLRRGMGVLAAERGRRISDLYAEAVSAYLREPQPPSEAAPARPDAHQPTSGGEGLPEILALLDRHGAMLREIRADTASMVPAVEPRALAVVIAAAFGAGAGGMDTKEVRASLDGAGFRHLRTTAVRDVLLQAGVLHLQDGRWVGRSGSS